MVLPTSEGAENMGWIDVERVSEQGTGIVNVVKADDGMGTESDDTQDMETGDCMNTLLCQSAQGSVKLLRKSLNCMLKQDENKDFNKGCDYQKQPNAPL